MCVCGSSVLNGKAISISAMAAGSVRNVTLKKFPPPPVHVSQIPTAVKLAAQRRDRTTKDRARQFDTARSSAIEGGFGFLESEAVGPGARKDYSTRVAKLIDWLWAQHFIFSPT